MAFDPEFLELMPLTCTIAPPAATNVYAEKTPGTSVTPYCHVQYGTKHTYKDQVTVIEEGVVYLDGVYAVTTEWSLSIPIPGGTKAVKITFVDQNTDEEGYHHTALHFGSF